MLLFNFITSFYSQHQANHQVAVLRSYMYVSFCFVLLKMTSKTTHHQTKDTIRDASSLKSDWLCEPIPRRPHFMRILEFFGSFFQQTGTELARNACANDFWREINKCHCTRSWIVFSSRANTVAVFFDFVLLVRKWCI